MERDNKVQIMQQENNIPTMQQQNAIHDTNPSIPNPGNNNNNGTTTHPMKQYNLYYTTSRTNARLHLGPTSTDKDPVIYYAESSTLSTFTTKPQLRLREGTTKSSPMVAFAKIHLTSRHMTIGSGHFESNKNANNNNNPIEEELYREQNVLKRGDYTFSTAIGQTPQSQSSATAVGSRMEYSWRRDRSKTAKTVYECTDRDGNPVAELLSGGFLNLKKGGEVRIVDGVGKELEELVIMSALAIWVWEAGSSVRQGYDDK